nr:hypothetical protein [Tanacetum cinerariifolium]
MSLDVYSSEDACTDDEDDDFLVDEEIKIVEPDVDVHLFGIRMDVPFDNIGVTNLVLDDVLEGDDVDVINPDSFNVPSQKFTTAKEAKDRVYLHSTKSRRNLKLYKNDNVKVRASCDGKVLVFTMSQGNIKGEWRYLFPAKPQFITTCSYPTIKTSTTLMYSNRKLSRIWLCMTGRHHPRSLGKSLLLVDYMEGNILSQGFVAALVVLITEASQSRQHGKSESVLHLDILGNVIKQSSKPC